MGMEECQVSCKARAVVIIVIFLISRAEIVRDTAAAGHLAVAAAGNQLVVSAENPNYNLPYSATPEIMEPHRDAQATDHAPPYSADTGIPKSQCNDPITANAIKYNWKASSQSQQPCSSINHTWKDYPSSTQSRLRGKQNIFPSRKAKAAKEIKLHKET